MIKKILVLLMLTGLSGLAQAEKVKEQAEEQNKKLTEFVEYLVDDLPRSDDEQALETHKKKCKKGCFCCLAANNLVVKNCINLGGVVLTPDSIKSLFDKVCASTIIYDTIESNQIQTLTDPGRYCLAQNLVNSVIEINGSSITLDLNGHTIEVPSSQTGVLVNSNSNNVRIYNGLIKGADESNYGIHVLGAKDVQIEDLSCTNTNSEDVGICLQASIGVNINRVQSYNNFYGIMCIEDTNTVIDSSSLFSNSNNGLDATLSVNLLVRNCTMNNNTSGCSFYNQKNCVVKTCVASKNGNRGFVIGNDNDDSLISIYNSVTEKNGGPGFCINSGNVLVQECTSNYNGGLGFNSASSAARFYSNTACGNAGGNYNGVTTAQVVLPDCAGYWQNVDCAGSCP